MAIAFDKITKEEFGIIRQIVARTVTLAARFGHRIDTMSLSMDIEAAHIDCPLKLAELLAADDFNFSHDVGGIMNHMDRSTGKLGDCFVPRYAR